MNAEQKKNIKIGIFAVLAIATLCFGLNYLKGQQFFSSGSRLNAYFPTVDGLTDSSPVVYCGYKVGSVRDIFIDQNTEDKNMLFHVVFGLDKRLDIPMDSRVVIVSTDLLGGKGLELKLGSSTEIMPNDGTLQSHVDAGLLAELLPMKDQASSLMSSADNVMRDIDTLIGDANRMQLNEAIRAFSLAMKNIEAVTRNLDALTKASGAVAGTFSSTDKFMESLDAQRGKIDTIMSNLVAVSDNLANAGLGSAVAQLDSLSSSVNGLMTGNGNIAKLANDDQLYDNLAKATENLNRLLVDIRLNPSRYISISAFKFGGKQVYFSDGNTSSDVLKDAFVVCLLSGKSPVDMPVSVADKNVIEYHAGKVYKYLVMSFASQAEAEKFISSNNLISTYPDAVVEHYVDGEQKRL